ncbi:MAG: GGDEF domain-containing protein, partial [Actinomycetota bacterium]
TRPGRRASTSAYVFLVCGALACATYFVLPAAAASITYEVIGLASVVAIVVGVALHRPRLALGWCLLALGQLMFVVGDIVWTFHELVLHTEPPFPSVADGSYLGGYLPITIGLAMFVAVRRPGRDIVTLIDAGMITVVAALASWMFLVEPIIANLAGSLVAAIVSVSYPLADIVLIAVASSLLLSADRGNTSLRLLVAGLGASILADTLYVPGSLDGWYTSGNAIDVGWLADYVLWGTAALHPSMSGLTEPGGRPAAARFSPTRLVIHAILVVALPIAWVLTDAGRSAVHSAVLLSASTAFSLLIVGRMARIRVDLAHEGTHDPLTGLPNRRLLYDRIDQMASRMRRRKQPMAVFYVDLGGFKRVNDRFGHDAGDEALVQIARRLVGALRRSDTVARLGGDEFVVICENADESLALVLSERLRSAISLPIEHSGVSIELDAHIGVVVDVGLEELNIGRILADADRAMYSAKSAARD